MNIVKKMAVAATVLCAVTAANAQIQFGARLGYNLQSADGGDIFESPKEGSKTDVNMGLLGIGAGVVVNIPAGPIVIAPEVSFLYRTNANIEYKEGYPAETYKSNLKEFAVSVPIMVKWFPIEAFYIAAGFQLDIPIGAEYCEEDGDKECTKLDGKKEYGDGVNTKDQQNPERASVDLGIPIGLGYMIMPNLGVDFRFVLGLNKLIIKEKNESGKMMTFGLGLTYLF
ncbi:hypothetical protein R83H12_01179 [Fibrobacteria bacterium R8-3-H12]